MTRRSDLGVGLNLNPTDRLLLAYTAGALVLVLASADRLAGWPWFALLHVGVACVVLAVAGLARDHPGAATRFLSTWYPFAVTVAYYEEAGLIRHVLVPHDLDAVVVGWETRLLGHAYYVSLARGLGTGALELWHACYFSFYVFLLLPALLAYVRWPARVRPYVFGYAFTFLAHFVGGVVFPASGPAALRAEIIPRGYVVIPLMETIHALGSRGGLAFPSTHVAVSLVATAHAGRWFPRWRWLLWVWFALIAASTVVCTYHYVLDVGAGIVTGTMCLVSADWIWRTRAREYAR